MAENKGLRLAFYGDDFTGSTDALEVISRFGVRTVLFIAPPTKEQLDNYKDIQAIGIAGMTRSMPPDEMGNELAVAFSALKASGASHVHYKVCSTFDSSPQIGSIGKAIDIAAEIFECEYFSLLVAAPSLGRYCTFGNLFARMGTGSTGPVHRLDRHPSMSRHPVTPANESDLRLHLAKQTSKIIGLVNILAIEDGENEIEKAIQENLKEGAKVMLFDGLFDYQLTRIGKMMDQAAAPHTHFSVGSSGIEMALGSYWKTSGKIDPDQITWAIPSSSTPMLVVSGSCSPVTANQITWAMEHGFKGLGLDTEKILTNIEGEEDRVAQVAMEFLENGESVLIHTSLGMDDPRIAASKQVISETVKSELEISVLTSGLYGAALGRIIKKIAKKGLFQRLVIAGGDTSSVVARELGIEAVEMIASIVPGAPLCKALAPGSPLDGIEINFKGGQVGAEDYFGRMREGQ